MLDQHDLRPQKRLGQNFMIDANALSRLADAAELEVGNSVLEVGAGLGHLTRVLAERVGSNGRVIGVELDKRLIPVLRKELAPYPNVELVTGDMLEMAPGDLTGGQPYKVAANPPYYITSALIRHFLEATNSPRLLALTVQREVAARMTAGSGQMSILAVSVQVYGMARVVARVMAGSFYPRPQVDSAIVRIEPHAEPLVPEAEREAFFQVVRAGFSQKRKQLRNSLRAGLALPGEQVTACLAAANIDAALRAETLSVEEWVALYQAFEAN